MEGKKSPTSEAVDWRSLKVRAVEVEKAPMEEKEMGMVPRSSRLEFRYCWRCCWSRSSATLPERAGLLLLGAKTSAMLTS